MSPWLIPAHAGKTKANSSFAMSSRAHPRSRGENTRTNFVTRVTQGSSPLTRGKHTAHRRDLSKRRLIPAHAGKTILRP